MNPDVALRDQLGAGLGYEQAETGVWWGRCPGCGERASCSLTGLLCQSCDLYKPLDEIMADPPKRKLPAPVGIAELLAAPEPEEEWHVEGLLPASANALCAAYPKSHKTNLLLEVSVGLVTATPVLGRFAVPEPRRVGIVLMEDQAHRVRRRLRRICMGREIDLADLEGRLHLWFRPPLRLTDKTVVELGDYAAELDLDFLGVDSWAYVASGDSNSSDEVTPQLQALASCRVKRPGLTVWLTHHARKDRGESSDALRLTDIIRNSSAFGAWYDAGLVLSRKDETAPVTVRAELRDFLAPEPFAFTVEDQDPAGPHNNFRSGGWLRLMASEQRPEVIDAENRWRKLLPAVREYIAAHPGCTGRDLRSLGGRPQDITSAARWLEATGEAHYEAPARKGLAGRWHPSEGGGSQVVPGGSGNQVPGVVPTGSPTPPKGGGDRNHPGMPNGRVVPEREPGTTPRFTCASCGAAVGRAGVTCGTCLAEVAR